MLKRGLLISFLFMTAAAQAQTDFSVCPVDGRERLWAQKRLNADLMNQYIDQHKLRDAAVKVRLQVVDTGFDQNHIADLMQADSFVALPGVFGTKPMGPTATPFPGDPSANTSTSSDVSLVGDPLKDVGGHGTMVVSVIGAKDGIGVAPRTDLTISRITPDSTTNTESTDNNYMDYSIMHACALGHAADPLGLVIINDSWSIRDDEDGLDPLSKRNPALLKMLSNSGCLLVKAAGNSAFVGPLALNADDGTAVLSVSATQPFNSFADFSSTGEVSAPGEEVYALASHLVPLTTRNDLCELTDSNVTTPRTFISGTSFASPMTAGISAEIVGVLRSMHRSSFEALSGADKIKLVKALIEASSLNRHGLSDIDGLRAVLMAERWTSGVLSSDDFRALLKNNLPALCQANPASFDAKREYLSACSDRLDDAQFDSLSSDLESEALS